MISDKILSGRYLFLSYFVECYCGSGAIIFTLRFSRDSFCCQLSMIWKEKLLSNLAYFLNHYVSSSEVLESIKYSCRLLHVNRFCWQRGKNRNLRFGPESCLTGSHLLGLLFHYLKPAVIQPPVELAPQAVLLPPVFRAQVHKRVLGNLLQKQLWTESWRNILMEALFSLKYQIWTRSRKAILRTLFRCYGYPYTISAECHTTFRLRIYSSYIFEHRFL